jgi:tRNA modification GTPase
VDNSDGHVTLTLSAGEHVAGLDLLRDHLKACMGYEQTAESGFSARRRHLEALRQASDHLEHGRAQLTLAGAGELLAEDLRQAQQALGEITGAFSSDDLLGRIFSSFCIGK